MISKRGPGVIRVLIVEDDAVFRGPLRAALTAEGYAVVAVDSAEEAETVLAREPIDIVLSDRGLPDMDGAALAARHPGVPFVLMTGSPPDASPLSSVVCRLMKPFAVPHLVVVLREALEARGRERRGDQAVAGIEQ